MTVSTYIKTSFNGGELTPLLDGRIDYPKYLTGAKELTNFIPTTYGAIVRRPGTVFVGALPDKAEFYEFEFSQAQSYVLAFCADGSLYFFTGDGAVTSDGSVYSIPHGVPEDQLDQLQIAQIGDIAYITCPSGMWLLKRFGAAEFTLEDWRPNNGPFKDDNVEEADTVTVTGTTNAIGENVTVSFTNAPATIGVGSLVRVYYIPASKFDTWEPESHDFNGDDISYTVGDHLTYEGRVYEVTGLTDGILTESRTGTRSPLHEKGAESDGTLDLKYVGDEWGYVKITADNGSDYTAVIERMLPVGILGETTDDWAESALGGSNGFPSAITLHQQRLVFAGIPSTPQTIYGSLTASYDDFDAGTEDSNAYRFEVASTQKDPIQWLISNISLQIGTQGSEFIAYSSGAAITPTDIAIEQTSSYGSQDGTAAIVSDGFTIFIQAGGQKLREFQYDESTNRNYAKDLTKVANHIGEDGFKRMVKVANPYNMIACLVGDEIKTLTYQPEEEVFAWAGMGVSDPVLSIASIFNNNSDRIWMLVNRNNQYCVEYVSDLSLIRPDAGGIYVDSALSGEYEEPTQTVTGLDHLEGRTVQIQADGSIDVEQQVINGAVALAYPATSVTIGLPVKSVYQSMRLEGGSQSGVGQGKVKSIKGIIFRFHGVGAGFSYGLGGTSMGEAVSLYQDAIPMRTGNDSMGEAPPLLYGDTELLPIRGGGSKEYFIRVEHNMPTPCYLTSIIAHVTTDER